MKALTRSNIIVKPSAIHGYGVFATQDIPENTLIEECYCIFSDNPDINFEDYYFQYGRKIIIPSGFGFIYNHASIPNATHRYDEATNLLIITSKQHIEANEEIFIYYGKTWFLERNISIKKTSFLQQFLHYLNGTPARTIIAISGLLIVTYLMNVLTEPQQTQKSLENLSMTIPQ